MPSPRNLRHLGSVQISRLQEHCQPKAEQSRKGKSKLVIGDPYSHSACHPSTWLGSRHVGSLSTLLETSNGSKTCFLELMSLCGRCEYDGSPVLSQARAFEDWRGVWITEEA